MAGIIRRVDKSMARMMDETKEQLKRKGKPATDKDATKIIARLVKGKNINNIMEGQE